MSAFKGNRGLQIARLHSDNGGEFINEDVAKVTQARQIVMTQAPPYMPRSNGLVERYNGIIRDLMRRQLANAGLPKSFWSWSARYAAEVLKTAATNKVWDQHAFGEWVVVNRLQSSTKRKALDDRGLMGRFLHIRMWGDKVTFVGVKVKDTGEKPSKWVVKTGLAPKKMSFEGHRNAAMTAEQQAQRVWVGLEDPAANPMWLRHPDGHTQYVDPFEMDIHSDTDADEVSDLYDPNDDPPEVPLVEFPLAGRAEREDECRPGRSAGIDPGTSNVLVPERDELGKAIPVSSREVSTSSGETLEMWKKSIRDEIDNFGKMQGLYDADTTAVDQYKIQGKTILPCKMVFVKKVLTPAQVDKIHKETGQRKTWKAKSRMVICGNFSTEQLIDDLSTQNVDIGVLRMLLAGCAVVDISNAFLQAGFDTSNMVLVAPPPILIQLGVVAAGTVWGVSRAVYGMRESPRLWQDEQDEQLKNGQWKSPEGVNHYFEQSVSFQSLV
eukprot:1298839-Amphidinium_carterae.1